LKTIHTKYLLCFVLPAFLCETAMTDRHLTPNDDGSSYIRADPVRLSVTGTTSPSGEPEYYKYMYRAQ
jgi:hypothetical protein